jgi:hypothetical protein
MADEKMQPNNNDRPEPAKPGQVGQREQQSEASAVARPGQRGAPGRKPLFGN